jgi:hypothetical protein
MLTPFPCCTAGKWATTVVASKQYEKAVATGFWVSAAGVVVTAAAGAPHAYAALVVVVQCWGIFRQQDTAPEKGDTACR